MPKERPWPRRCIREAAVCPGLRVFPWLPFWELPSEFRALKKKKIFLNLGTLFPKRAVFALRTVRASLLFELGGWLYWSVWVLGGKHQNPILGYSSRHGICQDVW